MDAVIEINQVFKGFGDIVALNGVTFKVARGRSSAIWAPMVLAKLRQ